MTNHLFKKYFYPAALIISCCFVYSCENDPVEIDNWMKEQPMIEEATNIESYLSNGGKVKAKLKAPLMVRAMADTHYIEFPKSLYAVFYNDSTTQIESWVKSKYGKYYEDLNKVYLRDSVVVITVQGDTLKSPDLWWDQGKGLFYTDNYAEYYGKNQIINGGKGMQATQDLKTITFKEPTGVMNVTEKEF